MRPANSVWLKCCKRRTASSRFRWGTVQKGLQGFAVEDVVDQGLHWNAGPPEDRCAA